MNHTIAIDYAITVEFGMKDVDDRDELKAIKKEFKQRMLKAFIPPDDNPFGPGSINIDTIRLMM